MQKVLHTYKDKWAQIPPVIRRMIINGAIVLILWKLLYTFWLEPKRILDRPLTYIVASQTTSIMQMIWPESDYSFRSVEKKHKGDENAVIEHVTILKDGKGTIAIADNCNGLEVMVLYSAFIFCIPAHLKRKLIFVVLGLLVIHLSNLARCAGLVVLHLNWPGMFDFAHHYLFKIMVYAISFGLWVWYLKPVTKKTEA